MEGDVDSFPFVLALDLGRTVEELGTMSQREYIAWQAFYTYRAAMQELEAKRHR